MVKGWTSFLDPVIQYTASKKTKNKYNNNKQCSVHVGKIITCKIIKCINTKIKMWQNCSFESYFTKENSKIQA